MSSISEGLAIFVMCPSLTKRQPFNVPHFLWKCTRKICFGQFVYVSAKKNTCSRSNSVREERTINCAFASQYCISWRIGDVADLQERLDCCGMCHPRVWLSSCGAGCEAVQKLHESSTMVISVADSGLVSRNKLTKLSKIIRTLKHASAVP